MVDNEWRKDTLQLPFEKIFVPDDKLPDAEADNGDVQLTLNEMVRHWWPPALFVPWINLSPHIIGAKVERFGAVHPGTRPREPHGAVER